MSVDRTVYFKIFLKIKLMSNQISLHKMRLMNHYYNSRDAKCN